VSLAIDPLLKLPDLCAAAGLGPTLVYEKIKQGLIPPPLKPTPRTSWWPQSEILALNAATKAGASEAGLRKLVEELVKKRKPPIAAPTPVARVARRRARA
jgi:prophage regulatory protein